MEVAVYVTWEAEDTEKRVVCSFEEEFFINDGEMVNIDAHRSFYFNDEWYFCRVKSVQVVTY